MVVLELLPGGDLRSCLLRMVRERHLVMTNDLLGIAQQLASALEYLRSMEILHRDLAARNVLVEDPEGQPPRTVKLADFGLGRDVKEGEYYRQLSKDRVPFKWMAPEAIQQQRYSFATDMWSFGVLLWEILSLGAPPFGPMSALEVAMAVSAGERLARPAACPAAVYHLMLQMWSQDPKKRPSTTQVLEVLHSVLAAPQDWNEQRIAWPPDALSSSGEQEQSLSDSHGPVYLQPDETVQGINLAQVGADYDTVPLVPFDDEPAGNSFKMVHRAPTRRDKLHTVLDSTAV